MASSRFMAAALLVILGTGHVHAGLVAKPSDREIDRRVADGRAALMTSPVRALQIAQEIQRTARTLGDGSRQRMQARAAWLSGAALTSSNHAADAIPILKQALSAKASFYKDKKLIGDLNMALANANGVLGQTEEALSGLQQAFHSYHDAKELRSEALALQNIGTLYFIARDFGRSIEYYDQAASVYSGDPASKVTLFINRGNALKEQGRLGDAQIAFASSVELAGKMNSVTFETLALTNLAAVQVSSGKLEAATRTIERGLALARIDPSARSRLPALLAVSADIAWCKGDLDRAARLIDEAFDTSGKAGSKALLRDFEKTAYEIYKARGDRPQALAHLERFKQLDDQARALAASTNAALMSARFDFANQNARIAELRQNEAEQEATIQRNQVVFQQRLLGAALLIVLLLLAGFLSIRRSRNQVRAANDDLTASNAELERALSARTEFLATTSHEIRTPLNGILGMTQVLLADRGLDRDTKSKIELLQGAGETMKALVDDILDMAKIANGELVIHRAEMNLQRLLRDAGRVWEAQATTKGVGIVIDVAAGPERIVEDEVRLRQIVFNLMANAVKFTDSGSIRLSARFVGDEPDGPDGRLRIEIADTGIGIPPDRLEEIFESFRQVDGGTTRRHGGTGLGLAICRNLARAMGGDVTASSILGGGSSFLLELPCRRLAPPLMRKRAAALAEARILLVETNPLQRSILAAMLAPQVGWLGTAGDGKEAAALLADEAIDLVLADAGAVGQDADAAAGLAALARSRGAETVMLWPAPDEDVTDAAKAAGILRIVAKPVSAQELIAVLRDMYTAVRPHEEIAA